MGGRAYASGVGHASGASVAGGGGGSVTLTDCQPTTGVEGDTLTLTGTNFGVGQSVLCGGVAMDNATVNSSTEIVADIPAGVSGLVAVSVAGVTLNNAVTVSSTGSAWTTSAPGAGDDAVLKAPPALPGTATAIENFTGPLGSSAYLYENFGRYTQGGPPMDVAGPPWSYMSGGVHVYADPRSIIGNIGSFYFSSPPSGDPGQSFGMYYTSGQQQFDIITPYPAGTLGSYGEVIAWRFDFCFPDAAGFPNGGKFSELSYVNNPPGNWGGRTELSIKTGSPRYWCINFGDPAGTEINSPTIGMAPFAHPAPDDTNDATWWTMTIVYKRKSASGATDGYMFGWVGRKTADRSTDQMIMAVHSAYENITPVGGQCIWCPTGIQSVLPYAPYAAIDHATYFNVCNNMTGSFHVLYANQKLWVPA